MRVRPLFALLAFAPLGAVMCSPAPDQGTVQILTVDDPFEVDGAPPATEIKVQSIAYDDGGAGGAVTTLAQGPVSQATLNLGTYDESDTESLLVTATDSTASMVAWGETLPVELGAIAGEAIGVFVQRTGKLSRMPTPLADGRQSPIVGVLGGRYIFVAGGAGTSIPAQTQLYDLISWSPLSTPPVLPVVPESIAFAQLQALAITSTGGVWYDLTGSNTDDASAPNGTGAWADVAGGMTITSTDQSTSYVVGGTRTMGAPTSTVLVVSSSGGLSWESFQVPRLGATAAWVDRIGLVIEGGNISSDSGVPGAECLTGDTTLALSYPADTTTGAGMAVLGAPGATSSSVLLVGGADGTAGGATARVLPIPCGEGSTPSCTATTWQATLPTPLTFTQVFDIDASSALVVGEDASGAMHAYRLSQYAVAEVPFRIPRSHARAVRLPLGASGAGPIAVVGGATYIESFIP